MPPSPRSLDATLAALPSRYRGPGGAVAVVKDGAVVAQHWWGWADVERRIPFTPQTHALICSITKQFTCGLLLDQFRDPTQLDPAIAPLLPSLDAPPPTITELAHNQSGLRDYWTLAMLCGAPVEGVFTAEDATRLIASTRSLQFAPGTRYSYCNQNFLLLARIIEARTGAAFAELLRRRIFDPAGMPSALVNADTSQVAGGTVGYEGSLEDGFRPAVNRIQWIGDAGLAATLEDMIAWERFIDATRDDPDGLYNRLSAPPRFRDGAPAFYGFGLARATLLGHAATCHGGGLRGWRSFRLHVAAERASVVVLFNHMADPRAAALELLGALLQAPEAEPAPPTDGAGWAGNYVEPETGLAVRVAEAPDAGLQLRFAPGPEALAAQPDGSFRGTGARLYREGETLWMERATDHLSSPLQPCEGTPATDIEGVFHNAELDARITCVMAGGVPYGAFSGVLGQGAMQPLLPFGADRWLLPCPRALDYAAPGDWTLQVLRDASGAATGLRVGCWLARGLEYERG
jgi:D-aminopeptidase